MTGVWFPALLGVSLCAVAFLVAEPARASPSMNLECPELASERAEVEARFLASAVSRDAADLTITIRCRDGIAELEVSVGARDQRRGVSFASEIAREAILTNLDRALSELVPSEATPQSMRASLPEPIARPSAATPARAQAPVIAPTPPPPKPPVAAPCVRNSTPNRVRAEAALESWGSTLALAG
ncbi:MAG TPA: hypothetical protein VFQ35_16435, partial [Polyangiaceae bacterium]|nr:hypothetical protein [Polyangiaceae bacterium]